MPVQFPNLGSTTVPTPTGSTDFSNVQLTAVDGFVLSRVDGQTSVAILSQITGQPVDAVIDTVRKLTIAGLVTVPGYGGDAASTSSAVRVETKPPQQERRSVTVDKSIESRGTRVGPVPKNWPIQFDRFVLPDHEVVKDDEVSPELQRYVSYYYEHMKKVTYYAFFGLSRTASRREIRRAYFKLSKAFHPDRWFRRDLGIFTERLDRVFKWLNRAHNVLVTPAKREVYDRLLERGLLGEWELEDQARASASGNNKATTATHRRKYDVLVARGTKAEKTGNLRDAIDAYSRALKIRATADVRLRLAACRIRTGGKPEDIQEDVTQARRLGAPEVLCLLFEGQAYELGRQHARAKERYEIVLRKDPENRDALAGLKRIHENIE